MIDGNYSISEQRPLVEEYLSLRASVHWKSPPAQIAESGLNGALLCVCVRLDEKLVGFGRVLGDGSFTFYLQDIIVHPDHQGKGLGKAIMNHLMDYIDAVGGKNACISLMAAPGLTGYYEQFGFSVRPEGAPGMQRLPSYRRR